VPPEGFVGDLPRPHTDLSGSAVAKRPLVIMLSFIAADPAK